ncbi:MAG: hypothetical protein IKB02_09615 [Clostridia bacterium]|nr:hypothetical protein [Clostridia bacterium]
MTEKETDLCKDIGREMLRAREQISNDDYAVNPEQMRKFNEVSEYAEALAKDNNGTIEYRNTIPRDTIGAIAIRFVGELTFGEDSTSMKNFTKALDLCDGFNIEGTGLEDGSFIVTFYVSDVHVKKTKCKIIKKRL